VTEDWPERLREGYEAFNRGDFETMIAFAAPDIELADRAEAPDPGSYRGIDAARAQMGDVSAGFEDYRLDPEEIFMAGDSRVVAVVRQTGRGELSGVEVQDTIAHVWEIREGKIAGMRAYSSREEAVAAAEAADG